MTQDTNNQEWWEEEFDQYYLTYEADVIGGDAIIAKKDHRVDKQGYCDWRDQWSMADIKDFIRKVSQQSREDALKECVEMIEGRIKEHKEFGVQHKFTDHRISELQYMIGLIEEFKLPPKQ